MKPKQLSFMTRIIIGVLWATLCLAVLSVIIIRLRRNRSETGLPALSALEEHIETEALEINSSLGAPSVDEALVPEWSKKRDPVEYARMKRRELEQSVRIDQPSVVSPMVNPDEPSTVPAPAAEAKVSDQPSQERAMKSSDLPQPTPSLNDPPHIERLGMISEVLSLDSEPPSPQVISEGWSDEHDRHRDNSSLGSVYTSEIFNRNPIAGLYAEHGPMRRLFFLIFDACVIVGRNPQNLCPLPPSGERSDRQISREHFELTLTAGERWQLRCLSNQGLIINETLIDAGESALIKDRDMILIGETHLRFRYSTTWRAFQLKEHLNIHPQKDPLSVEMDITS